MTFIEKLESLCWAHGLSERALAKKIGLDQSAISRWRNRGSAPRPVMAKRLADLFGIPVDSLIDDTKIIPREALGNDLAAAAAEATKLFPKDQDAGQIVFEYRVQEKQQQRERAAIADFLRERARILKHEAAAMEKRAAQLDP